MAKTLTVLAELAGPGTSGVDVDLIAANVGISRAILFDTLVNLNQLNLISLEHRGSQDFVKLTELGSTVEEKQRD